MAHPQPRAADVFVADFERRRGGRVLYGVRVLGAFVGSLFQGLVPLPAVHDVVVRRRDDGTEVARIPVENPDLPGDSLRFVQADLASHSPDEFVAEWSTRS
ncbi:hypothetical protein SAMN05660662_3194 [Blastococcus aurantiacus]|uniref:Uncharacterized protein n=1 Tax=Blastococcus aurantiacus TaxID=1550231 RepID=A0A1G7NJF5_9ACTN|nr:hypothetical protein [Blastococcus aurantiacus]SDF74096.1 hypothetical protein SAMN05660662_3194 [Blastococcus aurantiacus]